MERTKIGLKVVKNVSDFLERQFRVVKKGHLKPDGSLVSSADHKAEQIFYSEITKVFPDDGFLSEESKDIASKNGYRWICDPLDGTHNFLASLPIFGCLLALEYMNEIIFSICSFPVFGELFVAEKGKGATLNGQKIHVSDAKVLKGGIFLSDGKFKPLGSQVLYGLNKAADADLRIRMLGSDPFSMTRVAMGAALVSTTRSGKPWDIAAPALLVEEAGGKITDILGKKWHLKSQELVATNGAVHHDVLSLFRK